MSDKGTISLDESGHIRVLPADKYDEAEKTAFECNQFLSSNSPICCFGLESGSRNLEINCALCSFAADSPTPRAEITEFSSLVNNVVDAVDAQAKTIESEKLKVPCLKLLNPTLPGTQALIPRTAVS